MDHGFGPQGVDADARIELGMSLLDEAAGAQDLQVSAHGRGRQVQGPSQSTGSLGPSRQDIYHPPAVRVGQRGECVVQRGRRAHTQPVIFSPVAASASSRVTACTV